MAKAPVAGLADRLRMARTRMHPEVLQKDAGQVVGRSAPCIGQWEAGKSEPSFGDLMKLAKHYRVSVDWLLGLDTRASQDTQALMMSKHSTGTHSVQVLPTASIMGGAKQGAGPYITAGRAYPFGDVFAWTVETDAMSHCASGDVVVVRREYEATHSGMYMVVTDTAATPTLRRCQLDGGETFFTPDSAGYPTYNASEVKIIGKVREIIKHTLLD